jgi:DNA-binding transcriptional LysR family regulator
MSGELDGGLLKVFVAIIECQGFSAAAERLHKTQSTVSQNLQRLEEIVGTPLIHRTSRSIGLTPSGETFLIYARQILKLHLEAVSAAQLPNEQVCIHLGMPEDYAQYCLGGMLKDFQAQFAQVRPDICCEMSTALVSRLHRGELDLVLGVEHAGLQPGEYLCDEPLVWVAAPSWSGVGRQSCRWRCTPKGVRSVPMPCKRWPRLGVRGRWFIRVRARAALRLPLSKACRWA